MRLSFIAALALSCSLLGLHGQGQFSGDLQLETQFYIRDTLIGASNTEHYDVLKNGGDSWLSLNYYNSDFDLAAGVRFDGFYNSNLHNPGTAYTAVGIGMFYIQKRVGDLDIFVGNIYDQFGSGMIFRAWEERTLGIDKSILGARLMYDLGKEKNWTLTGMVGQQKNRFELFQPIIMGGRLEGNLQVGENLALSPGIAVVNRTMDKNSTDLLRATLIGQLNASGSTDTLEPVRNLYGLALYNNLDYGKWSWYVEGGVKSREFTPVDTALGESVLVDSLGNYLYTSLTYSQKGLGITGQFRRIDHFEMRTSPNEQLLNGIFNYNPTLTRQNSWRLPARYSAVAQDDGEMGWQFDIVYTPVKGYNIQLNYSDIRTLNNLLLYREVYGEFEMRTSKKWKLMLGAQTTTYNQEFFEVKPGVKNVVTITPFTEFVYKFDRKKSIRAEIQYMDTEGDFGSWLYGLVEFNMAPHWSISVSDMYNIKPSDKSPGDIHYYNIFAAYTQRANRFYLTYTRQVEGIVCTGGVCRFEPAFNGVKLGVSTIRSGFLHIGHEQL
jgi:hypothetical protein